MRPIFWKPMFIIYFLSLVVRPFLSPAYAQDAPVTTPPKLEGDLDITFNQKFSSNSGLAVAAAEPGTGYASLRYSIGLPGDKEHIKQVLDDMSKIFPKKFGNTSGTYTVTITVSDMNHKILAKTPIISFQWTKERGFLFIDRTVNQIQQTTWNGTLVNEMLLVAGNNQLEVSVEVYSQADRSLDFELLKKTSAVVTSGALASYFPLPAATAPILEAVTNLISDIYANSKKYDLIDTTEIPMETTDSPIKSSITINSDQDQYSIPIYLNVGVHESRIIDGDLKAGKFGTSQVSTSTFNSLAVPIGDGKTVSVVDLILSSNNSNIKVARPLLDAILSGGSYDKERKENDVEVRCAGLFDALNLYLSRYDARAMFYSFLLNYGSRFDKDACLGPRKAELDSVGLIP